MKKAFSIAAIVLAMFAAPSHAAPGPAPPGEAPITPESAGRGGAVAVRSVVRITCAGWGSAGTGFLHKSGRVITAAHVVAECGDPAVVGVENRPVKVRKIAADPELDLALLSLEAPLDAKALPLGASDRLPIGLQVSTWGFPGGYGGSAPLLSVGYLSGVEHRKTKRGTPVREWVVNAAFNPGNSGGPLIDIASGEVVGVVSSKLSPIVEKALETLATSNVGVAHTVTLPDGTKENVTERRVIALVLRYLRDQVQLVIGKVVPVGELRAFLAAQGVDP